AYLVLNGRPQARVIVDLSQFEAERDVQLFAKAAPSESARERVLRLGRSGVARLDRHRWRGLYTRICAEASATTICSREDRDRVGVGSVTVVPNAYPDPGRRAHRDAAPERPTI